MTRKRKTQPENHEPEAGGEEEHQAERTDFFPDEQEASVQHTGEASFPIVGIGASAGGLEACEIFFNHLPPDSGMAFVLVQHLDPTHESILVDLIKRATDMDVFQVEDRVKVQPDSVYVIPPNRDIALLGGRLHLIEPTAPRGFRLPIDYLFRSLADDLAERAICIILSGTGSDGTLGLKAVRGAGGMAIVQSPESAKYDGMPRSAIATDMVDYVLPPDEMPEQLIDYARHLVAPGTRSAVPALSTETSTLEKIHHLLRAQTKHDFSQYKQTTINRRIERRMVVNHIDRITDYVYYLQKTPVEIDTLFRDLLIGVTSFFRDPEAFEALEKQVIPQLLENRRPDQPLRVWVPGCSTGEESYSIAMLIREQMSTLQQEFDVHVFATDIDEQAITSARMGVYPDNIAADITPERLRRFFVKEGSSYQVSQQIREMVVFAVQSVIKDPPFSRLDLISCRNVLIYLGTELQKKVVPSFHYALKPGSFLFLGTSESLGEFEPFFVVVDKKAKLFQSKTGETLPRPHLDFGTPTLVNDIASQPLPGLGKHLDIRQITERVLLQEYTPPCVVINEQSEIVFFSGKTGPYLEPTSGEASLNIFRMASEGLRLPISAAVRKAREQKHEVVHENIRLHIEHGLRNIRLVVKPVDWPDSGQGLLIVVFEDMAWPREPGAADVAPEGIDERDQHLIEAERELQATREYLQVTIEELETANEELKSTNEELQSANEELQSANEELETSKEELQSINEELVTVNSELHEKIHELTRTNNDMNNLLTSVDVGIVFLDQHLLIRRFNPAATQFINLIEADIGRPIGHIVSNLAYENLVQDAQAVLETLIPIELEVTGKDGRWYVLRIRPYRTVENAIDGLVLTFAEVTEQKHAVQIAQDATTFAESVVDTVRESLLVLDEDLRVITANRSFYQQFSKIPEDIEGILIFNIDNQQWDIPELRNLLEKIVPEHTSFDDFEVMFDFETIGRRTLLMNARQIVEEYARHQVILLAIEDVTDRNKSE
jgi:two-component system CheB/CheR fusion protein